MANPYYTPSGTPGTGAQGSSSDIRSEFSLIQTGLDKLPDLTADFVVKVNSGGTALEPVQFLAVAQGGTGVATLTDGGLLLGSGTGAVTAMAVLADGEMIVGDGTTDPSIESGATLRTSIGVGTADNVTFSNVTGITGAFTSLTLTNDLPVLHGGTGVSTLTDGGILLGSGTGGITATAVLADGEMVVGDGTTDPALESGATLRTSIGVGTADNVTFADITGDAGVLASLTLTTDLAVAHGGTGASTLTSGGILLGSGTGAITAMAVLADGQMVVGDGTTDPVAESGATLRTSIGVGTGDSVAFGSLTLTTDLAVAHGGTGASTLTSGGILLGSGTGAITAMAVLADGAIVIGDGTTDPVALAAFSSSTGTLKVTSGGTGVATLTDGGILLGSGTGGITATAVLADGQMVVGDGTTDPVLESGATLRTSIGVGTTNTPLFAGLTLTADLTVANGGTGASVLTDGGIVLGSGTAAVTVLARGTNGQLLIGSTGVDPVMATLTAGSGIEINNTAGAIEIVSLDAGGSVTSVATAGTINGLTLTGGPITTSGTVTLGGTLAISNADWSGADLVVANGGTGVSTLTSGGVLLGSGTGAITAMAVLTDGQMIVGDGTTDPVAESGATLRTSIGVGTGNAVTFSSLTLTTDLSVANGGTGRSTFTDGGILLGNGTGGIVAMAVLANSAMIVGDGTTDPVAESGSTLRASIGVGTSDNVTFANITGAAGILTSLALTTNLAVGDGGTGVGTLTNGGILLGSGTGAITAMAVLADGQMIVGDGTTDPAIESGATLRNSIGVGTGSAVSFASLTLTTDLAVAHGGTGVSTLTDGGILLGSGTGPISTTGVLADGQMIVGDGTSDPALESGATLRTSIGLGSIATLNTINDSNWSGTDLSVANGGTGVSSLTDGGILLGSGTGAITAVTRMLSGQMLVGTISGDPVRESGATLRTSIGLGSMAVENSINDSLWSGADLTVPNGGTGVSSLTAFGVLLGGGNGNLTALATMSDDFMIVGQGAGQTPVLESGATLRTSIGVGTGNDVSFVSVLTTGIMTASGIIHAASTTESTSTLTGSLHTHGGLGVAKNLHVNGNLVITDSISTTNTKIGKDAGAAITTGAGDNTAFGNGALKTLTTADDCTAIGGGALFFATGGANTAVGNNAGDDITTGVACTLLGAGVQAGTAAASNRIVIGTQAISGTANDQFSFGKISNVVSNDFGTDAIWSRASDERKKQDVNPLGLGLSFINALEPVTYRWKTADQYPSEWDIDPETEVDTDTIMTGLLAQQVKAALDTANTGIRFPGWAEQANGMQQIAGEAYIFPLINAIKELTTRLEALEAV